MAANAGPGQALPADGALRLQFDRPLHPQTVTRQSVLVQEASGTALAPPLVQYDPVGMAVTIRNAAVNGGPWLTPGQPYRLTLALPQGEDDVNGLRALDRATLDPSGTLQLDFLAGPATGGAAAEPAMDFCVDVLPIFEQRCGGASCHGSPTGTLMPAMSLVLDTSEGIARTAVGRLARGANTGPRAGVGSQTTRVFGIDMPLVDPGSPGTSYLLYKCLLAPTGTGAAGVAQRLRCDNTGGVDPVAPFVAAPSAPAWTDADRAVLGGFLPGAPMPYPYFSPQGEVQHDLALSTDELQRVRAWIAQGAPLQACALCL